MKYFFIFSLLIVVNLFSIQAEDFNEYSKKFDNLFKENLDSLFVEASKLKLYAIAQDDYSLIALSNLNIAKYYDRRGINNKAIDLYNKSLADFEFIGISDFNSLIYSRIAANYRFLRNYDKAKEYFHKAYDLTKENDLKLRAKLLNQIGDIYRDVDKLDSSFYFYYRSLEIADKNDSAIFANNYNNLGDLHRILGNIDSSLFYYKLSADILINLGDLAELSENYTSIALVYAENNKHNEAIPFITNSVHLLEIDRTSYELEHAYEAAVKIYSKIGNKDSIAHYLFKLNALQKSLSDEKLSRSILAIELEQDLKNKEAENNILKRENEVQSLTNYLLIAFAFLIFIAGFSLYMQIRQKRTENKILFEQNEIINKANSELKEAYDNIHDLNATKDKFFSIISHDLKGPVTSMNLMLSMIVKDFDSFSNEELKEIIEEFHDQTNNTLELLLTLLDWSRSQQGAINLNFVDIKFKEISQKNVNLLQSQAENKQLKIIDNIDDNLTANVDFNTIDTVMRNLISNSIKFTPENGTITIGSRIIDDKSAEIYVKDSGVGIPENIQKGLFKVGENRSNPGTNNEKGTGLGLLLCRDFVEMNGGKIRFESTQGIGATFFFTVPISR